MDQSEYDRLYRKPGVVVGGEGEGVETQSITVDGATVAPLRLTVVNSTPQERSDRLHDRLRGAVEVVGRVPGGVEIVRRTGGADYAGSDPWRRLMVRCGRLR